MWDASAMLEGRDPTHTYFFSSVSGAYCRIEWYSYYFWECIVLLDRVVRTWFSQCVTIVCRCGWNGPQGPRRRIELKQHYRYITINNVLMMIMMHDTSLNITLRMMFFYFWLLTNFKHNCFFHSCIFSTHVERQWINAFWLVFFCCALVIIRILFAIQALCLFVNIILMSKTHSPLPPSHHHSMARFSLPCSDLLSLVLAPGWWQTVNSRRTRFCGERGEALSFGHGDPPITTMPYTTSEHTS